MLYQHTQEALPGEGVAASTAALQTSSVVQGALQGSTQPQVSSPLYTKIALLV